ncbi:MAG: glyoxylate/hydroxypyruvate reductase A [Psychromonas sp.]
MKCIALITDMEAKVEQQWLQLLQDLLTDEKILLAGQISEQQAFDIDIAIVANPDPDIIVKFPNLIWIQNLWVGVEKLLEKLPLEKIKVVKLNDPQLTRTMSEAVLAWTLYLHRNMPEYAKQQAQKKWLQLPYKSAQQTRVSILGAGTLGLGAVEILSQHGYHVSCWSRTEKQVKSGKHFTGQSGLQTMLAETDILINLLPLTPATKYFIDNDLLRKLPKGAKLINFARGAVVNTNELLSLLSEGHIAHAVLDVFEQEPLAPENAIWQNPNITVLPHISGPTSMHSAVKIVAHNITSYRETGIIAKPVNTQQGY